MYSESTYRVGGMKLVKYIKSLSKVCSTKKKRRENENDYQLQIFTSTLDYLN